ncbi:RagB/SusD family nutrient uptake outer membrane protein [Echinicola vietnamensis]|uniref:RagB/SusD family protein n=1 Tax=Echinicola vietnamensis (strain DSM 17526 / LMG 23754 / KMM 6221) TaxID=926556 RepID=L0G683_ECHVK|nr:RagB/SusD family nutrient uptake outer membrane protein [Echinicola vietnamensis]AGA80813.1 RagB/SusD family protein [Echinicola vietnamensis DSM 17526]
MRLKPYILIVLLMAWAQSCNEEKLNPVNPNELSTETFYKTGPQYVAAVNAAYAALQANDLYNREYFFIQDLLSDDVASGGAQLEAHRARVLNHVFDGSNSLVLANWRGWYRVIQRANLVIANVDQPQEDISENLRDRVLGEAYFLRGLAYYELSTLWGGVPLMTVSATGPDGAPRASQEDSYQQVIDDLTAAIGLLPPKSTYSGADVGRASIGAAQAVLAKLHLFRGDFAAAKPLLQAIIDSGEYRLVDRYLDNFEEENENNAESLWEVQFSEDFGTDGGWNADGNGIAEVTFRGQEYGPTAWRNIIPNPTLVAEFEQESNGAEKDDPRYGYTLYSLGDTFNNGESVLSEDNVQGNTSVPSWRKYQMIYKREAENTQSGINFRVIRYADVLLMMAEVENETSGPASALPYINQVRARADVAMPPYPTAQYPTGTQEEMRRAIQHERRVELAGEQIRNRDIRRWRRMGYLENEPIPVYSDRYDLLPIPLSEIDNNSALTNEDQNPGF